MRDYRAVISQMNRKAQLHGDAPFVALDKNLYTKLQNDFDGSVASVAASVLSGGRNQVERLAHAFGPSHFPKFFLYLKSLVESGEHFEGLNELYEIAKKAYAYNNAGSSKSEKLQTKPDVPSTFEEAMKVPMHPDIADIKSHYRNKIKTMRKS
jgi:hypothetical protein